MTTRLRSRIRALAGGAGRTRARGAAAIAFAGVLLVAASLAAQSIAPSAATPLAPVRLHSTVEFLASDALEGRKAGERGAEMAARFVASEFLRLGLRPCAPDGSWFQRFDCGVRRLGEANALGVIPTIDDIHFALAKDFLPFLFSASGEASGELAFAGYGVRAPDHDVDDYASFTNGSLRGKVVLVAQGLPFEGADTDPRAAFLEKARVAARAGAAALLVAAETKEGSENFIPGKEIWPNFGAGGGLLGLGTSLATMFPGVQKELAEVNVTRADMAEQTALVQQYAGPLGSSPIPAAIVSRFTADRLLGGWGALAARLAKAPATAAAARVTLHVDVVPSGQTTANVVAILDGSDERLRDEYVVVGAHYDHVGKNAEGEVWNGADDNASGTATILGLAAAFAAAPPKRSILFIAFGAEEKGLLGSLQYLDDPLVPLAKTVAMLNLDMVGRNAPDHVTMIGARSSPELEEIAGRAAKDVGLTLDDDGESFFDQSDHAGFYHRRIPVVFLTSMEHPDYHHATDTADKIDGDKMERIARLSYEVVREVADRAERPTFVAYRSKRKGGFGEHLFDPMFSQTLRR
ncbi:MAG: M28 family peptidase [Planctomycetes bacterium]|nr:M28 family peptidase [Planctomycetota bacterium]